MQKSVIILSLLFFFSFLACTKGPGTGGRATIKGRVFTHNYNSSLILQDSGYLGGQKVYIKYGDQVGVGDDVDTDNQGIYVFPYLRKGEYTIYTYSKTFQNNKLDSAVIQTVTVSDRKETAELPDFDIITFKN
jgi:hypothetical protein